MTRENEIRKEVLLQLYAVRPLALLPARIARDAKKNGYDYTEKEVARETAFLRQDGMLEAEREPGTTGNIYQISAKGIVHFEQTYSA